MFRRLTGIFILLSFLLVKSTSLFAIDKHQQHLSVCSTEQEADEVPDLEKECKQLEIMDEDYISHPISNPFFLLLSKKLILSGVANISDPYISLPYLPPNGL
ncbi:hypothetical protein FBD94_20100 [Pedobacter hiemivivus]|uniref:Uncharacterized protein n=1 Tax=Pedobacter hiemivivus TaxID=2530454 RepID=A0A4V6WPH7_9SPHI|nr:hypothetical protein [Pedobacter hiemivivus]TKC57586.1 hypothetical protein FBD94_20100 [Pedobacter hiemivivus]